MDAGDPWQGLRLAAVWSAIPHSDPPQLTEADPLVAVIEPVHRNIPTPRRPCSRQGLSIPTTGRPVDPRAGNLMWLLHRQWAGDGANSSAVLLDAMTNPGQCGDPAAAGALAKRARSMSSLGDDGLGGSCRRGCPADLPDGSGTGIANIAARYMGSILAGGRRPAGHQRYVFLRSAEREESGRSRSTSAIPTEAVTDGTAIRCRTPPSPKALTGCMQDTENRRRPRDALLRLGSTSSGIGAAQDLQEATATNQATTLYGRQVLEYPRRTRRHRAQVLRSDDRDGYQVRSATRTQQRPARWTGCGGGEGAVAVGKEIIGAHRGARPYLSRPASGVFNNMLVDDVVPTAGGRAAN